MHYNVTFHGVGKPARQLEPGQEHYWLTVEQFNGILKEIANRKHFTITIDDGNLSDIEIIFPALEQYHMTAKFFIAVGKIGEQGYLCKEDIRQLSQKGMVIGTHGIRHCDWRTLDDRDLTEEINISKHVLEDVTGQTVTDAACPFGSYDRRVLQYLKKANYRTVYTCDQGPSNPGDWLQARTSFVAADTPDAVCRINRQGRWSLKTIRRNCKTLVKQFR